MSRALLILFLTLMVSTAATATGPLFDTPPVPDVPLGPIEFDAPPVAPPVEAPPLDLLLPERPERPLVLGDLPDLPAASEHPMGPPDLTGRVDLPSLADHVYELAPPFGGSPAGERVESLPTPEPGTGALLAIGVTLLGVTRRRHTR